MPELDITSLFELKPGDTIRHKFSGLHFTVTETGGKTIAAKTIEVTKPEEWYLVKETDATT